MIILIDFGPYGKTLFLKFLSKLTSIKLKLKVVMVHACRSFPVFLDESQVLLEEAKAFQDRFAEIYGAPVAPSDFPRDATDLREMLWFWFAPKFPWEISPNVHAKGWKRFRIATPREPQAKSEEECQDDLQS
jgi:hypothetical protein